MNYNEGNIALDKGYELETSIAIEIAINKCMGNDVMED